MFQALEMAAVMPARGVEFQRELALGRQALIAKFQSGSSRVLRAGQLFVAGAQPDDTLYRLRAGWAYRFRNLADGNRAIVDVYLPGDIIGFDAVLCDKDAENVRTLTTAAVEVITAEHGVRELLTSRSTALYILRLISERQRRADRLLATISCLDARGRMAAMVLDFYQRLETQKLITALSFNLPLTQHHIGSFLGMTVVHVNRVIRALRDAGLINIEKHHVTILDLAGLAHLARMDARTARAAESG
jgi:CRP/FNR family transcriptional regulator, anaerobic regulatory protein